MENKIETRPEMTEETKDEVAAETKLVAVKLADTSKEEQKKEEPKEDPNVLKSLIIKKFNYKIGVVGFNFELTKENCPIFLRLLEQATKDVQRSIKASW